ncbi:MAG: hypothetical protein HETSPECPRED_005799 [Heterodermia speciosa]|uniref:Uncharacterized protein n=1 Tax=Heterodermia speciosa TaxID=116794 RepID=A0A8H3IT49_9LECA|nr:MAG: hypothetical protein HETSPECPRED_005799 [Heterodermia speciosa]
MAPFFKTPLLPEVLATIPSHQRDDAYQHETPSRDAQTRRHTHNKNDRNLDAAIALGQDPNSDISGVRTRVRHFSNRNFQDQFEEDGEGVRRRMPSLAAALLINAADQWRL